MYKTCLLNTSCDHQLHLDHTNTSPELQHHSIVGNAEPESNLDSEELLQLDSISVSPQATCNFETESLPEFKGQLDDINQEPTDTPSTIPTAFQAPRDDTYNPECTHNPMEIQCNQYPNHSHNSALPQFLAHHNCEDLDPTDTPSAVPAVLQAPKHCTHNPSTRQVKKSNHTNPMALPYPPDPGEHVMERSATPTVLVERDILDPSSLAPPKGEMESSFSWTYLFKSPTSSTLCFDEPTLRKLNQVKLLCNPTSSTLCDFTLGKLNQETGFLVDTGTPSLGTNRVSDCHSSVVTTPSSRLILDKPKIEVNKALIHHIGKNGEHFYGENFIYDFLKSWKHIKKVDWGDKLKLNYTTFGYMLMEIDWGGMNESLLSEVDWGAHDSSVFLFLVNIDYDAKPNESSIQGLWGELQHRTSSVPLIGLQTDSLATGQTGDDVFNSIPFNPDVDGPEQLTGESIQSFLTLVVQLQWLVALGRLVTHAQVTTLPKLMVA